MIPPAAGLLIELEEFDVTDPEGDWPFREL